MDPLTQGALGAAFAQTKASSNHFGRGVLIGALAGMAPDLDVFIRSSTDPLMHLQYHRHFTHSLFFIPLGALLCALVFWLIFERVTSNKRTQTSLPFKYYYRWSFLGYATHGALDVCTSYGTQIFWPITDYRAALDIISVIDPLFTLPGMVCIVLAMRRQRSQWLRVALCWWSIYLALGAVQHHRAESLGLMHAQTRGHAPESITAKPSFANIIVWKTIYSWEGRYYVDAVKPGLMRGHIWPGENIATFDSRRDLPWLKINSLQDQDIRRFAWFSDQYIARDPRYNNRIADIRYSLIPNQIQPLWSIEVFPNGAADRRVAYRTERSGSGNAMQTLWRMIAEEGPVQCVYRGLSEGTKSKFNDC